MTNEVGHEARPPPADAAITKALLLVVIIWGLGPSITKLITAPPVVAAAVRFWISLPVVLAVAFGTRRPVTGRVLRATAIAGLLFAANLVLVFAALQRTSVAVLAVVQALNPGLVLVIAGRWLGERPTAQHVLWTAIGVGGVIVVVLGGDPEVSGDAVGLSYAAASLLAFVAYYVISRRARSTTPIDPIQWIAGVTIFAAIGITPFALLTSSPADFGTIGVADWTYLAFVSGVVGIVSHAVLSWIHAYVPATRSSTALLAFNVVAVVVAWPINGEAITVVQAVGGIIVLGSVAAILRRQPAPATHLEDRPPSPG